MADDDPVYRDLLEDLLTRWDFEPVIAKDGVEALAVMAEDDPPKLMILDWDMPEIDGFEVTRSVRNGAPGRDAYILMITGSRRKEDMMRVLVCGADDYLIKPFDPMDLKIHLRSATRILHLHQKVKALEGSSRQQPMRTA